MTYTREDWARALAHGAGNASPTADTIHLIRAWTELETAGPPGAAFNLLNTTEPNTPGVVSDFNSAGVKNFDTFAHGIQANVKVLGNGYYPDILHVIRANVSLFSWSATLVTSINHQLSTWGTGPVVSSLQARVAGGHLLTDLFPGTGETITPPVDAAHLEFLAVTLGTWWNSGIQKSWLAAYEAGTFYGPALTPEIHEASAVLQFFAGALCTFDAGGAHWRKNA